jgi:MarR family transcriptional regulator for hemolysin
MNPAEVIRINRALNKIAKLYRAAKAQRLAALGLHPGQDVLLWVLAESDTGMTISELAARLGVESPTATRSLARMEETGLFRREPVAGDRRQVRVVVTDRGRALLSSIERVWADLAEATFGHLPAAERTFVVEAVEGANERLRGLVGEAAETVLASE